MSFFIRLCIPDIDVSHIVARSDALTIGTPLSVVGPVRPDDANDLTAIGGMYDNPESVDRLDDFGRVRRIADFPGPAAFFPSECLLINKT